MTDTYRYRINEYSHKLLDIMFFKFSPIMRRSGKWDDSDKILESELYNTAAFANFTIDELRTELNIPDVLLQDVCEYLEMHKHIEVTQRLNNSVIEKIRATKLGLKAFKFQTYLEKNETLIYQDKFKQSVLDTNNSVKELNDTTIPNQFNTNKGLTKTAIWVAAASALISLGTFLNSLRPQYKEIHTELQKTSQTLDSLRQNLDSINASLKNLKTISYKIDTTKK